VAVPCSPTSWTPNRTPTPCRTTRTCWHGSSLAQAFADPTRADHEITHAEQLLAGLDQRATTLTNQIAALTRDAGTPSPELDDRAALLRTEIATAGITAAALLIDLGDSLPGNSRRINYRVNHPRRATRPGERAMPARARSC
jgi:uncharacterized protein YlxW (UPF0749 family)